jgi:glucokinase
MTGYIISADIGGTKTLLQAAELKDGNIQVYYEHLYPSRDYASFSDVLRDFLNEPKVAEIDGNPAAACFAVAGPIAQQKVSVTNLPWLMDAEALAREFSIPVVKLINDFKAVASGTEVLSPGDLVTLQPGKPHAQEVRIVLGAGTGMGVAWLIWQEGSYISLSSEGGHMDFAPADELQDRLLQHLRKEFGHVSVERLLSGPGLTNIFNFLSGSLEVDLSSASGLAQIRLNEDGAAQVSDLALKHKHPIALKAMNLFVEIYGAYAGSLALAGLSRGGVYVAGGIAPKIIDKLREGGFMKAFRDKGRFSALMGEIPVHVVMNPKVGLLGATREAQRMMVKNG